VSQFMVGRQPIFDARFEVHGYELLFRGAGAACPRGEAMTADVLVRTGLDLGLEQIVGNKLAFLNVTREFLVGTLEIPLPPRQTVVEVQEGTECDDEMLSGCRHLANNGFSIALDHYSPQDERDPLLEVAQLVKLDVLGLSFEELLSAVRQCSAYGVQLVAERVETREQLRRCQDLGFDFYQGYLLRRPDQAEHQALDASHVAALRLVHRLCDPRTTTDEIVEIVRTDPAMSVRFLRAAGAGAAKGLFRRVRSVRDAVVLLGQRRLRAWAALMLLSGARDGPSEPLNIALTRARMAELITNELAPELADAAFTVGLVSGLDAVLGAPVQTILETLTLDNEVEDALTNYSGLLGHVLREVVDWELGGARLSEGPGLAASQLEHCYLEALAWSNELNEAIEPCAI